MLLEGKALEPIPVIAINVKRCWKYNKRDNSRNEHGLLQLITVHL